MAADGVEPEYLALVDPESLEPVQDASRAGYWWPWPPASAPPDSIDNVTIDTEQVATRA